MAKKSLVKDQDKFIVRLPQGMRDRIKTKADRAGMSMNEAIVWALEHVFPAPVTLEERLDDLAALIAAMKTGDLYERVDMLVEDVHRTLGDVWAGKLSAPVDFKENVSRALERWEAAKAEDEHYKHDNPFDTDDEVGNQIIAAAQRSDRRSS